MRPWIGALGLPALALALGGFAGTLLARSVKGPGRAGGAIGDRPEVRALSSLVTARPGVPLPEGTGSKDTVTLGPRAASGSRSRS